MDRFYINGNFSSSYFVATFMAFYVHLNIIRNKYKMMKKNSTYVFCWNYVYVRGCGEAIRIYVSEYLCIWIKICMLFVVKFL